MTRLKPCWRSEGCLGKGCFLVLEALGDRRSVGSVNLQGSGKQAVNHQSSILPGQRGCAERRLRALLGLTLASLVIWPFEMCERRNVKASQCRYILFMEKGQHSCEKPLSLLISLFSLEARAIQTPYPGRVRQRGVA